MTKKEFEILDKKLKVYRENTAIIKLIDENLNNKDWYNYIHNLCQLLDEIDESPAIDSSLMHHLQNEIDSTLSGLKELIINNNNKL